MTDPLGSTVRGSRKFAVSLFADLTGYTALCERLDPEDVERAVAPLMIGMQQAVTRASGVVLNVAGDGLFAIFGVPDALADSPERAISVARQMRDLVAEMNQHVEGIALPDVHIGIAAGEVLVTQVAMQASWSVIGTSVNLASRLCDAASASEILVDDGCRRLLSSEDEWDAPRTLMLKGQSAPTLAWPLCSSAPPTASGPMTAEVFVGRGGKLAALSAELEAVRVTGTSRTVVIRGVAGIGKSRLVQHWLSACSDIEAWHLECDESHRRDDLHALNDAIDASADQQPVLDAGRTPAVDRSDPYPLVVHALRANLKAAVSSRPRILVIENLHHSDTILGEFLLDLAQQPLDAPLLVVATWRDEVAGVSTEPHLLGRSLPLESLERPEMDQLFASLTVEAVDQQILDAVADRTQGHPLMVREAARHWAFLQAEASASSSVAQEFRDTLPNSLRMFLAARIDRLDAGVRAIVYDLSALGAHFHTDWVAAVLGKRAEGALPFLAKEGVLKSGDSWSFSHDLIREVAYATLTRTQRADLHRRQLELLDDSADPRQRADHALAWHQSISPVEREQYVSSTAAAVRESLALGRQLYARQARAALDAVRRATSVARDCVAIDPGLAARLWSLEAQSLAELGLYDDALRVATQAEQTAATADLPADRLAPLMTRGLVLSNLLRFESARQTLDEAARIADEIGDRSSQAEATRLLAETWRHSLIGRFVALTEEAYHLFTTANDNRGAGDCARMLAYLSSAGGLARFQKWRDAAGRLTEPDDLRATAALAMSDAIATGARFQYEACREAGEVLLNAGEELEAPELLAEGLLDLTEAVLHLGEPRLAADAGQRLIDLATAQGNRRMRAAAAAAVARPLLRIGDLARSSEELRIAKEMAQEFGHGETATLTAAAAACLADRGFWDDALRELRRSLDAFREGGFSLGALGTCPDDIRMAALLNSPWPEGATRQAITDALELDAPLVASFISAIDAWGSAENGEYTAIGAAPEHAPLEELATRADIAALQLEIDSGEASPAWRRACDLWEPLGYTIWLARAQARSGDVDAARHTLDVLDSPAEARAWALGDAAS